MVKIMKKTWLLLLASIALTGCSSNEERANLKIVSPTGAPAVVFYNYSTNDNFQTNSDPSNIIPMMLNETVDVAVLPTNAGIQAIVGKKVNYKIAATITFGNIFIGATGNDDNGIMDADDYIVSFQQGAVPDKIFHYVYGNTYDNALHYVSNGQEAAKCLKMGKNLAEDGKAVDYVVLAEPALTTVISSTPGRTVYANLQELYKVKSGNLQIFQASLFVNNKLERNVVDKFLEDLEKDINAGITNPEIIQQGLAANSATEALFGIKPEQAKAVTANNNGMGLGFANAKDNKEAIDLFLSLFGIGATNEEIYY